MREVDRGYHRPVHHRKGTFDSTRGYPGEGPLGRSNRGERITIATINITSWRGGVSQGALDMRADILMLQETRLTEDAQRASRAEARRAQYWGLWTPALRRSNLGAASGGLASVTHTDRPWRKVAPEEALPHFRGGRWSHVVIFAGGTELHVFNVYGWPAGTPDQAARQSAAGASR